MPITLTESLIKKAAPPEKGKRLLFDDHRESPKGFGVRISPTGLRTFILRYRTHAGQERIQSIGNWPAWSLTAARAEANAIRRAIDGGDDPLDTRRTEREAPTLADVAEDYMDLRLAGLASAKDIRGYIERDLLPKLGKKKIAEITRRDIIELIQAKAEGTPAAARNLLANIKPLFNYAEDRELIEVSPIAGLKATRVDKSMRIVSRGRTLSRGELKDFWTGVEQCGMQRLTAIALKLILVTGQRPKEVAGMRWDEIEDGVWTIPASRRLKTETAHAVPLSQTALDLLADAKAEAERLAIRRKREPSAYVFEQRQEQPTDRASLSKAVVRKRAELGNRELGDEGYWHPHDLRRTCRTGLAELGFSNEIAERVLGHVQKGIAAVYDRYQYGKEIRAALEAWERHLLTIVGERADNVIEFRKIA